METEDIRPVVSLLTPDLAHAPLTPVLVATLDPQTLIVAVAGTNATSSESIDIDLDFKLVNAQDEHFPKAEDKGVLLHQGFYGAFQRIIPDIESAVDSGVRAGVKTVIVTGHSLGAVIASLAHAHTESVKADCQEERSGTWSARISSSGTRARLFTCGLLHPLELATR